METLNNLSMNNPTFANLTGDLQAKLIDAPFSEELTDRMRKLMIDQGIVEPSEEEIEKFNINTQKIEQERMRTEQANQAFLQAQAQKLAAETAKLQEEAANKAAATDKLVSDNQGTLLDNQKKVLDNILAKQEAGIPLSEEDVLQLQATYEITNDDLADSWEERQQLEQQLNQVIGNMQAQATAQQTAAINPAPEANIQGMQMKDL